MMGRGAEGTPASLAQGHKMDIYAHAIKGLALKSPFAVDEGNAGGGSGITGYTGFRVRLPNSADPKRKNRARKTPDSKKRSFGELEDGNQLNFWNLVEDFFREVNEQDIQILFPRTSFRLVDSNLAEDRCFNVPSIGRRCFDVWADEDSKLRGDDFATVLDRSLEQAAKILKRRLLSASSGSKKIKSSLQPEATTVVISSPDAEDGEPCCHVCNGADSETWNQILTCDSCNVAVHQECYGVQGTPHGPWLCSWCSYMRSADAQMREHGPYKCMLCPVKTGALKPVAIADSATSSKQTRFAHLFCAQWIPETFIENMSVRNVEAVAEERWRLPCIICKEKHGACVRCSEGVCGVAFHPLCAKDAKLHMELRGDAENMDLRAYCKKHSSSRQEAACKDDSPRLSLMNGKDQQIGETQKLIMSLKEVVERLGLSIEAVSSQINIPQQSLLLWLEGKSREDENKINASVCSWLCTYVPSLKCSRTEGRNKEKNGYEAQADLNGNHVDCSENCQLLQVEDDYSYEADDRQNSPNSGTVDTPRDDVNSGRIRSRLPTPATDINDEKFMESTSHIAPGILKRLLVAEQGGGCDRTGAGSSKLDAVDDQWRQLQHAKDHGVMDWVPQDEVEAEIFLLQNQLIDSAQSNRLLSERLLSRILRRISDERQAVRKQMHDLTLVTQFLADAKEARRLGRREKRDKEAQASLAAANAAVAASPRIRRDAGTHEDAHQDSNHGIAHVRAVRPPVPKSAARVSVSSSFRSQPSIPKTSPQVERLSCDICNLSDPIRSARIVVCNRCGVAVHKDCYGVSRPAATWFCQPCLLFQHPQQYRPQKVEGNEKTSPGVTCLLCPKSHGALRRSSDGRWVHMFCALWIPKACIGRDQSTPIDLGVVSPERFTLTCSVCRHQQGACLTCYVCHAPFHPICARDAGFLISARSVNGSEHYRAFCERHSPQFKVKPETASLNSEIKQQYESPDEVNVLRQIRVEFERVRLICERVCKRERMKRDLIHCMKEVHIAQLMLAANAHSVEALSHQKPFDANGSLYSDTLLDVPWAESRITSAGGESILPVGRGGGVFVKEVVSKRSALPEPDTVKDERKLKKYNRHSEPLGNERVMTPSEASMQNKLLPRGLAYVPLSLLDKGKQHEAAEPQQDQQVDEQQQQQQQQQRLQVDGKRSQ